MKLNKIKILFIFFLSGLIRNTSAYRHGLMCVQPVAVSLLSNSEVSSMLLLELKEHNCADPTLIIHYTLLTVEFHILSSLKGFSRALLHSCTIARAHVQLCMCILFSRRGPTQIQILSR